MDRSDPEAMAAERHQDRLDEDADARDVGRWVYGIHDEDGEGQEHVADSPEDAAGKLHDLAAECEPDEGEVEEMEEPSRTAWRHFWQEMGESWDGAADREVVAPCTATYYLRDTL